MSLVENYISKLKTNSLVLEDEESNMKIIFENMIDIYTTYTRMNRKKVITLLENEKYLNAHDCLKLGIVDRILH